MFRERGRRTPFKIEQTYTPTNISISSRTPVEVQRRSFPKSKQGALAFSYINGFLPSTSRLCKLNASSAYIYYTNVRLCYNHSRFPGTSHNYNYIYDVYAIRGKSCVILIYWTRLLSKVRFLNHELA